MSTNMPYRLALDIGSTSIGWALFRLNEVSDPYAIIRAGVRIFPDGRNPKDGSSLAVTRRDARAMRRRRDRLLKRKVRMMDALVRLGFFPADSEERRALTDLNPYELRAKGLDHQLTGEEFARALFHINQRRGFLSNRKTDKADTDSGALKKAISELRQKLMKEECRTLGEWLAKRHHQGDSVRARLHGKTQKDKQYDFYADRAMIEHEFDTLWEKQASFDSTLFSESARLELKDILLHQRPLKPVIPGRCTLIPDVPRAPLALPSTQRFRILQELNNLRIELPDLQQQTLTIEQRNLIADLMERKASITFSAILKALKLPGTTRFNLQDVKRDQLKGNLTSVNLSKPEHFGDDWHKLPLNVQDEIVVKLLEDASLSHLVLWLQNRFNLDESIAERIADTNLPEGYGNLSLQALQRIVPALQGEVITYDKAVLVAGFDSHSALSHSQQTGEIMPELPYYGIPLRRHVAFEKPNPRNDEERYGKIANPTVHIGLNQLRVVVNDLIKQYGHPRQIIVEVARDLKMSREKKLEIQREQKQRQDLNYQHVRTACDILGLNPDHLDKSKRRDLSQKMQLWVELNPKDAADRRCPYTGEKINIERLLNGDVEIEHILPFKRTLDDSMNNKTVSLTRANRAKGNQTPFEAFGLNQQNEYDYDAILQRALLMPSSKKKRFAKDGMEQWLQGEADFLPRALNDTAYLSRIAKEYLSCICPHTHVWAIPGRLTGMLRGKFGLNQLLSGNETKNRDDHRHHALDACVIGITDRSTLNAFSRASQRAWESGTRRLLDDIESPWPNFRAHVERALTNIIVSQKPEHGYQGAMHEASAWGLRKDGLVQRRKLSKDGLSNVKEICKKDLIQLSAADARHRHGLNEDGSDKAYKGYLGGSNYCMEIWIDEKGRWNSEVVSTFDAYQIINIYGEENGWKKLRNKQFTQTGKPLIMRLMNKDYLRLEVNGNLRTMVIATIGTNGQVFMADQNEANVDARNRDKNNPFGYVSKMASSLQKAKGRLCTVSPSGKIHVISK